MGLEGEEEGGGGGVVPMVNYLLSRLDNLKLQSRSLEDEVSRLREENAALKAPLPQPATPDRGAAGGGGGSSSDGDDGALDGGYSDGGASAGAPESASEAGVLIASRAVSAALLKPPGARPDLNLRGSALVRAIRSGDAAKVRAAIASNPALLEMRALSNNETMGFPPLLLAADAGRADVCAALLELGADVAATDLCGRTALHIAAAKLHNEAAKVLMARMGDVRGEGAPQDVSGITPAGYSALSDVLQPQTQRTDPRRTKRAAALSMLHATGDACISPLVNSARKHRSARKSAHKKSGRRSAFNVSDANNADDIGAANVGATNGGATNGGATSNHGGATGMFASTLVSSGDPTGTLVSWGAPAGTPAAAGAPAQRSALRGLGVGFGSASLPGYRVAMEDAVCIATGVGPGRDVALFAVFDGHGGRAAADFCAHGLRAAVEATSEVASGAASRDPALLREALRKALLRLDRDLAEQPRFAMQERVLRLPLGNDPGETELRALDRSGAVATLAAVTRDAIVVANVGDSRTVLLEVPRKREQGEPGTLGEPGTFGEPGTLGKPGKFGGKGEPVPPGMKEGPQSRMRVGFASRDHTQPPASAGAEAHAFWAAEKARVEAAGGAVSEGGRVLFDAANAGNHLGMSRALGDFEFKVGCGGVAGPSEGLCAVVAEPETYALPRSSAADQFLVLACDGVWDVLDNEECGRRVVAAVEEQRAGGDADGDVYDTAAEKVALSCLHSNDNVSIVIVHLEATSPAPDAGLGAAQEQLPGAPSVSAPQSPQAQAPQAPQAAKPGVPGLAQPPVQVQRNLMSELDEAVALV